MARRTLNRRDLRAEADAVERRNGTEAADSAAGAAAAGDEVVGDAKPKKKAAAKKKAPATPRPKKTREKKVVRLRVVWTVFDNSNRPVGKFEYPRRSEADALAAKLTTDKKSTHFVQAIKEPMEEPAVAAPTA